jgi:hypothetical protein
VAQGESPEFKPQYQKKKKWVTELGIQFSDKALA